MPKIEGDDKRQCTYFDKRGSGGGHLRRFDSQIDKYEAVSIELKAGMRYIRGKRKIISRD